MRILVVNWQCRENPLAGGAEIHLHEIFERLAGRGHEVTLLCGGWKGAPPTATLGGIETLRVGTRQTFALKVHRYWKEHLNERPFDILVEDINKAPLYTPLWGATAKTVACVPHLFGGTVFQELSLPLATAVWLSERPIPLVYHDVPFQAISESTADDLAARGIPRRHVQVIYPGVSFRHYTPDASRRAPTPTFSYIGRLKKYKGVDLVIRAFAALRRQDAVLEIAGAGDYRGALETLARSLDLGERVRFLGFISEEEKIALLRRSWAVSLASPKEGWGLTNVEAAACGTPVVASDSPGIRESVRDGGTGFLVPHGDTGAMATAFGRLKKYKGV
ncbi:MAG: glycosyltransferase family 4 protein, partial [Gemmatimonadetes bacterium]|nr:glycosyltransferase family 4 protein [Gemmatimonadota bacterium]